MTLGIIELIFLFLFQQLEHSLFATFHRNLVQEGRVITIDRMHLIKAIKLIFLRDVLRYLLEGNVFVHGTLDVLTLFLNVIKL